MLLRVLIVEDSADDAQLLVRILTKQGFEVESQTVETEEAMRQALHAATWDVILADHKMSEFNAIAALATLQKSGHDVPFIIVSGVIGEDIAVEAMKAGAHDYIMKGNLSRLVPAIKRELRDAAERRERRQAEEVLRATYAELERRVQDRTAELARLNEELHLQQQREIAALTKMVRHKDEAPSDNKRLRVLIVEDSADDAKLLLRFLTKQGFEVETQRVDTEATMRAALQATPWDVILSDHIMPGFSALGALQTMHQSGLDLPFIIISGLIGEDVAVEAMLAGAHDYIMKGNLARLAPAIRRELREATVRRERREADEALLRANAELEMRVQERTEELAAANEELAAANEELVAVNDQLRLHQEREIAALKELDQQKDEFLSIAAHELKTPVTSVLGFAQVVLREYERQGAVEPERLNHSLNTIVRQAKKLGTLVSQLLDISRIEAGRLTLERESIDLVHVIQEVVAAAGVRAGYREITVHTPAHAMACVDSLRFEQVVTNLVSNAIRHSAEGPIEVGLEAGDRSFMLSVRDHGKGISPEHLPHIFERFYQVDKDGPATGMGLGLFITREIVALHGGEIEVQCPPDGGTSFVVSIPASAAACAPPPEAGAKPRPLPAADS